LYIDLMSAYQLMMLFAIPLETLRLIFVWREVSRLAREKGLSEEKWGTLALGLWLGVVGGLSTIAFLFFRHLWLVIFFTAIVFSSILYRHLIKRPLEQYPDIRWEDEIETIGKPEE
jgi:hypothetical protein